MDRFDEILQINLYGTKPYFSPKMQESSGTQFIDLTKNDNKQDHEDKNKKETTRPRCEAWNC